MHKVPVKQLICAATLAGACATASAALTTTTDLGTLELGATAFNGAVIPESSGSMPPFGFADFFTFELPASGGSDYTVLNFPVPQFNANLTFASLTLFSMGGDGAIGGTDDIMRASSNGVISSPDSLRVSLGPTDASEKMYLFVSGFATGSEGGLYSGAISVSPVPEPEMWAMMLVGAGLVGFRLRNRSKKFAANRLV